MERFAGLNGARLTASVAMAAVLCLGGCSPAGPGDGPGGDEAQVGWLRPPAVTSVSAAGDTVIVRGRADPRARVLLRAEDDATFATSADGQGRFEIRFRPPAPFMLLRPQVQSGPEVAAAPERLLLVGGAGGAAALVTPGEPIRRLDRRQRLEAMDSDGRVVVATGTSRAGTAVAVSLGDRPAVEVEVGPDGRWSARLGPPPADPGEVTADGQSFVYPGAVQGAPQSPQRTHMPSGVRDQGGWRATWSDAGAETRDIWLPDGA